MRILHVIQELGVGGAERITVALAHGARAAGHDVAIAAAPGALAADAGVDVHPLPLVGRRVRAFPRAVAAVRAAVRAERPDVLHVHNPGMAAVTAAATRLGAGARGFVSVHGIASEDDRAAARVLRLARFPVVACGTSIGDTLVADGVHVVATIENGVPAPPPSADCDAVRREWGIQRDQHVVLSVGRLVRQKNHELAIDAVARVPDAVLAIVGDGPDRAALRTRSEAAGVADRVVFTGARPDAWALMGAADAVVLPSRGEGMPLTLLEALAIGAPVVATRVRGVRELVVDGESALLAPPDDADAVAAALTRVLDDRELRRRLSANGRKVAERFDEAAMVERYLRLYERVAAGDLR